MDTANPYIAAPIPPRPDPILERRLQASVWNASGERICECYSYEQAKLIERALNELAQRQADRQSA